MDTTVPYEIRLEKYGQYTVQYKTSDSSKSNTVSYVVSVLDTEAPVFKFEKGFLTTAKVGSTYVLPEYSVSDNATATENIQTAVFVVNPHGRIISMKEKAFVFDYEGSYYFRFVAYDVSGNMKLITVEVRVTK